MRRTLVWLRKEAREHAARLRLLMLVIPAVTSLAGWIGSDALLGGDGREIAFGFAAAALVLHGLVLSSGLFASETAGPAAAPVGRLPGAWGHALGAKALIWLLSSAAAAVAGALATAGVLWLLGLPERAWEVLTPSASRHGSEQLAFAGEALVYSACLAVAAACVRQAGSAVAAGTILFALLLGPVVLAGRADARVFPLHALQALSLEALGLGLLAAGATAAWLFGRRRLRAPWAPATWAAGVMLVLYGTGAVHAATALRTAARLTPSDADWRIDWLYMGAEGHVAFATVDRHVAAWPRSARGSDDDVTAELRMIDLATGRWTRVGREGASFLPLPHGLIHRAQIPALHGFERMVLMQPQDRGDAFGMPSEVRWLDGRTGAVVHRELDGYPDARGVSLERDMLRDLSPVRDAQGRRTWLLNGFLEREGDAAAVGVPQAARHRFPFPVRSGPGCWTTTFTPGQARPDRATFAIADVDRGIVREAPNEEFSPCFVLSPDRLLVTREHPASKAGPRWSVLDLATGALVEARNAPVRVGTLGWPLAVVGRGRVLASRREAGRAELVVWEPETGAMTSVAGLDAAPDFASVRLHGPDVRGRLVLALGGAWALLEAEGTRARLIASPGLLPGAEPLLVEEAGSVLFLEDHRRIVRAGASPDHVDVLFPRSGAAKE